MASVYFNTQVGVHEDSMTSKAFIVCDHKVTSLSGKWLFYYLKINFVCAVLRRHQRDVQLIGGHSICDLTSCCNQLSMPHIMFFLLAVYDKCMTTTTTTTTLTISCANTWASHRFSDSANIPQIWIQLTQILLDLIHNSAISRRAATRVLIFDIRYLCWYWNICYFSNWGRSAGKRLRRYKALVRVKSHYGAMHFSTT